MQITFDALSVELNLTKLELARTQNESAGITGSNFGTTCFITHDHGEKECGITHLLDYSWIVKTMRIRRFS